MQRQNPYLQFYLPSNMYKTFKKKKHFNEDGRSTNYPSLYRKPLHMFLGHKLYYREKKFKNLSFKILNIYMELFV